MEKFRNPEVLDPKRHPKYPKSERNWSESSSDTNFFWYRIWYFFRYQIFTIPNPILFYTKFFWYRIRNNPKNGKVSKPRTSRREVSKPKRHTLAKIGPNFFDFSLSLHCSAKQSLRINSIVHATQATNNKHKPKQASQQSDKWKYLLYVLETSRIPLPCWTFHL